MGGVLVVQAGAPVAIANKFNTCLKHLILQPSAEKLKVTSYWQHCGAAARYYAYRAISTEPNYSW
jgi:hypothetical protein